MIAALVLHIVLLHAQMTVPWIGGAASTAASTKVFATILDLGNGEVLALGSGEVTLLP